MDFQLKFKQEREKEISLMAQDQEFKKKSLDWMIHADKYKYTYNYSWLGRPIIKFPNDILAMQEIIWKVQPDIIVETGIAHGGSILFSASMLQLIGKGEVIAVDIDIRQHNRKEIENHPLFHRITLLEGSSINPGIFKRIEEQCKGKNVLVVLDSLHTHKHVLHELKLYSKLVTKGSYLICPDTFIEFFPKGYFKNRPWDVGNNTYTALKEFLLTHPEFKIDHTISNKLMITEGFDGYLIKTI